MCPQELNTELIKNGLAIGRRVSFETFTGFYTHKHILAELPVRETVTPRLFHLSDMGLPPENSG